jgi:enoyl-CoA hydratase/carnithine racemase
MSEGVVHYRRDGVIARVTFDRPEARNAMTWGMYDQLAAACDRVRADPEVRVAVFRGAGGKAFVAGTDIGQFREFKSGEEGVTYERRMSACFGAVEALPVPAIAAIEGWAVGGGLMIAAACDVRLATPGSRFGVPIARTLGNCLSIENYAALVAVLGLARTKRMLLLAENLTAEELVGTGFVAEIVTPADLDSRLEQLCSRLAGNAPITMRVTKESLRRLLHAGLPASEDLIRECYGSADFRIGVASFLEKRDPVWTGK